ncbi:MAG: hypothetical protein AAGF84_10570 [Planctomycetota bacterium]
MKPLLTVLRRVAAWMLGEQAASAVYPIRVREIQNHPPADRYHRTNPPPRSCR